MRVSTSQIYSIATLGMTQAQAAVTKTQEQMATGKRVLSPADDPVAATSILQLNQELARTEQYKKNINVAENSLNLEDTSLQTVSDLVQRMRELAVKAGNTAVLSASDYRSLAAEVDTRINELLNLQNTRNASGQYIFAGYQSGTKPFVGDGGGNFSYLGDEGQLRLQASASVTVAVTDSGKRLFVDVPSGHNTFNTSASPSNQSIPPAVISVGQVYDQEEFDRLYPQDLVVSFSKSGNATLLSVSERSSGKLFISNQPYMSGDEIKVAGASFKVLGTPYPGDPAIAGGIPFNPLNAPVPAVAVAAGDRINITVAGRTEVLEFPVAIAAGDTAAFVTALNDTAAVAPALSNAQKLAALGVTLDATGFSTTSGANLQISDNTGVNVSAMLGDNGTRSVSMPFGEPDTALIPFDFSASPQSFQLEVNGRKETITFNQPINNTADLVAAFNTGANLNPLARLGISVTPQGLVAASNTKITISGGTPAITGVLGINTLGVGSSSTRGVLVKPGDSFLVESTDKQGLLTTLSRFSDAMKNVQDNPESKAELAKLVAKTLTNLENGITNLAAIQGEVGSRLNTLESSKDLNLDTELFTKTVLSSLQDLDYADASIKLSMQSFVLTASQQSFAKVSQLTLFSYL